MKKARNFLAVIFALTALFSLSACSEKDEWDGVQVSDNSLVQTAQVKSGLVNPPTVVCDLAEKDAYVKLTESETKPASVILRLNDKFNVTGAKGEKLCSFSELYNDTLKGKIIPIIYLSDEADAQRAIKLFTERYDLFDAAVMSDNPTHVKTVREKCPKIGGIVEFNELEDIYDAVRITNANLASVAVIPQRMATQENVFYLQARFRTVWVRPENSQKPNLYNSINSGAYGVVSEDYESIVQALGEYDGFSSTRMPFVVAHRGLPNSYNENSVSGVKASIAAGATHLELDGYLTADNRIAMMHDYTIDRTSDGEGVVENYTLEKLQKFNLDLYEPYEPIPSLDDVFEEMKGTDTVLLFEVKSEKVEIVNALKTALEKHRMQRQVVVITYHSKILEAMLQYLPEIPTADLSSVFEDEMEDAILKFRYLNTGTSTSFNGVTPEMNAVMRDRGIVGWYWTYDTVLTMAEAMSRGFTGLTTNVADEFVSSNSTKYVYVKGDDSVNTATIVGEDIPLIGVTYNKTEEKVKGKIIYAEDLGDRYAVVASFSAGEETNLPAIYTQIYYVNK